MLYINFFNSKIIYVVVGQPSPVFLPGEPQRWGRTESDTTEVT